MTARQLLAELDRNASKLSRVESQKLWDVLTALRGPDDGNYDLKMGATAHIRAVAFPHWCQHGHLGWTAMWRSYDPFIKAASSRIGHFHSHAHAAARALGIKPGEVVKAKRVKKLI